MLIAAALYLNWAFFSVGWDFGSQAASMAILLAALLAAGAVCHLFPMFARYELTIPQYFLMSSRFAVRHLAGTAILLFVSSAVIFACRAVPGLIPFFGVGAWLYVTGWLCDRFFTANDDAMATASINGNADAAPAQSTTAPAQDARTVKEARLA